MPNSPKYQWPFPNEHQDPFFEAFTALVKAQDDSVYAAKENAETTLTGGGTIAWDSGTSTLSWTGTIEIPSTMAGFLWQISAGSAEISDGSVLYVSLAHAPVSNVVVAPVVGNQLPVGDPYLMIAFRRGTSLYFRNGVALRSGESFLQFGSEAVPAAVAISGLDADWSRGRLFTKALDDDEAMTFSNVRNGKVITIVVTSSGSFNITWPASVMWQGGTEPVMTDSGTDIFSFFNDGVATYGSCLQNFS